MKVKNPFACLFSAILLLALSGVAFADNYMDFGDYRVHYNAFTTDTLPPQVAKTYGIRRSGNRALLNITVLKKVMGTVGQPVPASVTASATNLTGQFEELDMREVREGQAIYYISDFRVANKETMDFKVNISVEGLAQPFEVGFRQQFYTD